MITDQRMQQLNLLLEDLSTGVLTVTNLTLLIHELLIAIERIDPFAAVYPTTADRVQAVTDCLQLLCARTPEPLRGVLLQMIANSVPHLVQAISAVYADGKQSMLDYLNGEKFLYARQPKIAELSPMGRRYALHKSGTDTRDTVLKMATMYNLPERIDLRESKFMPAVLDQGSAGTCAAHASANALHFCLNKEGHGVHPDWSPCRLYIYFTVRVYIEHALATDDTGCSIRDVCKAIRQFHDCDEKLMPYSDKSIALKPSALAVANANLHGQVKYSAVQQSLHDLQATLSSGYPIICGIQVYASFEQPEVMTTGTVPMPDTAKEQLYGGHAILLVGYNNESEEFTFQNSWGLVGKDGFFTIPYKYICSQELAGDFWVIRYFA
jgi:C1A family cysteine protease